MLLTIVIITLFAFLFGRKKIKKYVKRKDFRKGSNGGDSSAGGDSGEGKEGMHQEGEQEG